MARQNHVPHCERLLPEQTGDAFQPELGREPTGQIFSRKANEFEAAYRQLRDELIRDQKNVVDGQIMLRRAQDKLRHDQNQLRQDHKVFVQNTAKLRQKEEGLEVRKSSTNVWCSGRTSWKAGSRSLLRLMSPEAVLDQSSFMFFPI